LFFLNLDPATMAYPPYFSNVTSKSALKARFKSENGKLFAELDSVSASHWGRSHLLACRVVRREPQANLLPAISKYTGNTDLQSPPDEIKAFLQGPDPAHMTQSEHFLVRQSGYGISLGQVWAAMAMLKQRTDKQEIRHPQAQDEADCEPDDTTEESPPKPRLRKGTFNAEFTDSSTMQVDSSSPLPLSSSFHGSQTSSLGYVDSHTHYLDIAPEDNTLRLASCVIRHILYFAPPQDSASNSNVVEFRDAKIRLACRTVIRNRQIVAIDDGGLCLRRQTLDGDFVLAKSHVAILEAKPQFQCLEENRPVISDRGFGQMVCEALAARLSDDSQER
jgi:hypothetical protein